MNTAVDGRTFLGEPRALAYLAFTEAWERFSYYGMTALLVLYMTQSLLLPGHVEHIVGFPALRAGVESVFGPMTTVALASQIYGLYTGFIYFTPVLGGWIADRWMGPRNAVVLGAILMSAGHVAMAFDASFILATPKTTARDARAGSPSFHSRSTPGPSSVRCCAVCSRNCSAGTSASGSQVC
jgi:POT family proton-dependent oligopeptide transporter